MNFIILLIKMSVSAISIKPGQFKVGSMSSYPACLADANHWWYDATDLATITKDGSDFVSAWNAKGGAAAAAKNYAQATGTNQPLWVTPGTIRFDGIDNFMQTGVFTWNQPCKIYALIKHITWTAGDVFWSSNTWGTEGLRQYTSTPRIYMAAYNMYTDKLVVNTWSIVRYLNYGADSILQVNNEIATNGQNYYANFAGMTLGRRGQYADSYSYIEVHTIVCVNTTDAANETEIYNWLVTRLP